MKTGIHPVLNPVVFVDSSTGAEFVTTSTMRSDEKKKIGGVEYFVIHVDISSDSHPFYTGKQTLVDTAGRVDKFRARMEAAKEKQAYAQAAKEKKEAKTKETASEKVARKAKENTEKKEAEKEAQKAEVKQAVKKPATKAKAEKTKATAPKATKKKK